LKAKSLLCSQLWKKESYYVFVVVVVVAVVAVAAVAAVMKGSKPS